MPHGRAAVLTLTFLALLAPAGQASALSPGEAEVIQRAAAHFLDSTPENNFLLAPTEVRGRLQSGKSDFVLVDVRSEKEFELWHLPGAISIPVREIAEPRSLAKLSREREIILYCNSGHESTKALSLLRILDYPAFSMKWGMMGWRTVPATAAALRAIAEGTTGSFPTAP